MKNEQTYFLQQLTIQVRKFRSNNDLKLNSQGPRVMPLSHPEDLELES